VIGADDVDVSRLILLQIVADVGAHVCDRAVAGQRNTSAGVVFNKVEQSCSNRTTAVLKDVLRVRGSCTVSVDFRGGVCDRSLSFNCARLAQVLGSERVDPLA